MCIELNPRRTKKYLCALRERNEVVCCNVHSPAKLMEATLRICQVPKCHDHSRRLGARGMTWTRDQSNLLKKKHDDTDKDYERNKK